MFFPSRDIVERVKKEYPAGTRVELVRMDDCLSRIRDNASYQDL